MEYAEAKLRELALGALLHDLGQTLVPAEIANKPGKLTPEEMDIVRQHTQAGFDVLRKIREVSIPAAHIAYQHHENYDGTGYPRKLKGDEIHEYARIVTVANIFDALISERPFRKAFPPHEAHEILMTLGQKFVDRKILNIFLSNIAIYPIGSVVQLSTGQIGVVTDVSRGLQARPQIKLIADEDYSSLPVTEELDLTRNLTVFITKLLKEQEIIELSNKLNSTKPKNPAPAS
jgi:HD-GYP domain-containing protein (c-di-GMP phosphodiesterase class II)